MDLTIIQKITIWAIPIIFAITVHEVAHGWVASWLGDQTARLLGRLTLNPIKHIDLFGTILVPILMLTISNFVFGWAKPVPVDPRNLRRPRRDMAFVALAGPLANLLMACGWALLAKIGLSLELSGNFNMGRPLHLMGAAGVMINIVLGVLNLLPLPPLDGGKVLLSLVRGRAAYYLSMIEPYSFFILILLLVTGVLNLIMGPMIIFFLIAINQLFNIDLFRSLMTLT